MLQLNHCALLMVGGMLAFAPLDPAFAEEATAAKPASTKSITYTKDVAPILFEHCARCHRTGEVGPFSLMTYEDASKRAEFITDIAHERRMPPYHADPNYGDFKNVRRLSDDQLATLAAWAKAGAPEGDKADLPKPPVFVDGWQLGEPDLILKMPEPFTIPAVSRDIYQVFVLPTGLTENRTVAAVEFRPGNRKVVHHAIMYLDNSGAARRKDVADKNLGYRSFGGLGFMPSGGLGGWAPGVNPLRLPEGFGKFLAKGSDLALQVHYHPSGKEEADQSQVGIYFTKEPAKRIITGIALFNTNIFIPPGEQNYRMTEEVTLPCDVNAMGIWPHMHLIGREMKVTAVLPDGTPVPMLWVKDWDFNWQDGYEYREPVKLPKGTKLKLEARYDNSQGNPQNPNNPPAMVHFGEETTDEMCLCTIVVYPDKPNEMSKLFTLPHSRLGAALGGGTLPDNGGKIRELLKKFNNKPEKKTGVGTRQ